MRFSDLVDAAFAGIDFTVLFFGAVFVADLFRGQGKHLFFIWMNDGGLKDLMMVAPLAVFGLGYQTAGAVDFL